MFFFCLLIKPNELPPDAADSTPQAEVDDCEQSAIDKNVLELKVAGANIDCSLTAGIVGDGPEEVAEIRQCQCS